MERKGRFKEWVWEGKEGLKDDYGKEGKVWMNSLGRKGRFEGWVSEEKTKVQRKRMGKKGRFKGRVWVGKKGLKKEHGKWRKV